MNPIRFQKQKKSLVPCLIIYKNDFGREVIFQNRKYVGTLSSDLKFCRFSLSWCCRTCTVELCRCKQFLHPSDGSCSVAVRLLLHLVTNISSKIIFLIPCFAFNYSKLLRLKNFLKVPEKSKLTLNPICLFHWVDNKFCCICSA